MSRLRFETVRTLRQVHRLGQGKLLKRGLRVQNNVKIYEATKTESQN